MLTLVISHNINLSREERYNLHQGKPVTTVGVSVPVWFEKGNTSEPAQEVFVLYRLTNTSDDYALWEFNEKYPHAKCFLTVRTVVPNIYSFVNSPRAI